MKPFCRLWIVLVILFLTACEADVPESPVFEGKNPYAPRAGDAELPAKEIDAQWTKVFVARSQPPQLLVSFTYFPPTDCHKLRVDVSEPNAENQIHLKAYLVAVKDDVCNAIVLEDPLLATVNLGSFSEGLYTVVLNGDEIGEFYSPKYITEN